MVCMTQKLSKTKRERLKNLGIRHFDELIHDQPREWLIEYFSEGAKDYPINVSLLMRNIIWQTRERVISKQKPPLKELVRTYWYMYIKPTLARVSALSRKTDQYNQLVSTLVDMVKDWKVIEYKDIGFRDDNQFNRNVGLNANVILFSEKLGHQDFLSEIADKYQVSIIALGGQPSVMNVEYFVDDLKKNKVNIQRSFFLFSIVDYDPSGWIIRNAFINDLKCFGIKNIKCVDLVHPDMLTEKEVLNSKYPVPLSEVMQKKNTAWLKEIKKKNYKNQKLLGPFKDHKDKRKIFGLEAEAVSSKRLKDELDKLLPLLLGKSDSILKISMLEKINKQIKSLILHKLT